MRYSALLMIGCVATILVACGTTTEETRPASEVAPPPGSTATDTPPSTEPKPDPPKPGPECTREAQAKTAPVSLFDEFQKEIGAASDKSAREAKLLADIAAQGGTPLSDPKTGRIVFLAKGAGSWKAAGSFVGWDAAKSISLTSIAGTSLQFAETNVTTSFEYKLVNGNAYLEDPLARNVTWDGIDRGFGKRGEMNSIGRPDQLPKDKGRMVALGKVHATKLNNDREVWVWYPPAYDDGSCKSLPSIVFHDGLESLTRGDFVGAAQETYSKRPELSAVLVFVHLPTQEVRMSEYSFGGDSKGPEYIDFLASDLWPKITKDSRVCKQAAARGISGASLGGLISTFGAFEKPEQWGWVGAQSASLFWDDDAMIKRAEQEAKKPIRFYLDSGCPADNCDVTDQLASVLKTKGYDYVRIKEDKAEHDWSFWKKRLPGLLTHFRDKQTACD